MLAPVVRKKATKYNREERIITCTLSLSFLFLSYGRRRRRGRRTNAVVAARRRPSRRRRAPAALSGETPLPQPVEIAYGFATPAHVASTLFGFGVHGSTHTPVESLQFHTHLLSVAHDEEESCMLHMYQFFSMSAKNALVGNAASYAASVGTHVHVG